MKAKPTLTKAQITYAIEMYQEHGYNAQFIAQELNVRTTTVIRYLEANGVEVYERDEQYVGNRASIIGVFKSMSEDFGDLDVRNYKYILALWEEVKNENASNI